MKKLLAILVAGFTLVACSNNENSAAPTEATGSSTPAATEASSPAEEANPQAADAADSRAAADASAPAVEVSDASTAK